MLIDTSYFTGLLDVGMSPCPGTPSETNEAEEEKLQNYIEAYEPEYLEKCLGEKVSRAFNDYLNRGEEGEEDEKWEKLKAMLTATPSPVACYVYFMYVREVNTSVTRQGVTVYAGEDAVSPASLQRRAWNKMAELNRKVYELLESGAYEDVVVNPYMVKKLNAMGL